MSQPVTSPPFFIAGDSSFLTLRRVQLFGGSLEETPPTQPFEVDSPISSVEEGDGFVFPELRYPPVSPRHDTSFFNSDMSEIRSQHGSSELFIGEEFILKRHVMRYIDCTPFPATAKVVAITRDGRHIVWQQAIRSCVPAAISMLALDRGKTFLAEEIAYPVTNNEVMLKYIRKAGFEQKRYALTGPFSEKLEKLQQIIAETGPGLLHLNHPDLESHMIVLDEISSGRMTVRDPYHGNMLTIKLYPFVEYVDEFIALSEPEQS